MKIEIAAILALAVLLPAPPITSAYTRAGRNTYRTNGSQADVNAAVSAAPDGATIEIPAGTFTWTGQVKISKFIHLKGASRETTRINNENRSSDALLVFEAPGGNTEISDCEFISMPSNVYVFSLKTLPAGNQKGKPILLHDCSFRTGYRYAIEWDTNGGVIWNCYFVGDGGGLHGISFVPRSLERSWNSPSTMGKDDRTGTANTYVEDCTFKNAQIACTNFDDNSRVVMRHCTFDNAALGSHGQETSVDGTRHWEIYDNKFICTTSGPGYPLNLQSWLLARGGTGVITGNEFPAIPWKTGIQLAVFSINRRGQIPCQTRYPAARQIGQSWKGTGGYSYPSVPRDGSGYYTEPVYIWNNTGEGASKISLDQYTPDECGNGQKVEDYIKENRDYVLGPKPGWERYPYPHPLRTGLRRGVR